MTPPHHKPGGKIRALVIEDSLTVRKRLIEALGSDGDIEVVGEAADGRRGIDLARELRPDVITVDMILPVMSGLAVTEYVMAHFPTPILVVSASTNRGELFKTYEALAAGAVDVLDKPHADQPDDGAWERQLIDTVKLVSRIRVITHPRGRLAGLSHRHPMPAAAPWTASLSPPPPPGTPLRAVGVGASTGGPAALLDALGPLPARYPLPILLVIHIGESFAPAFGDWLGGQLSLPVAYARDQQPLPAVGQPGVWLAPPDRHLVVRGGRLWLAHTPERHSCRPSVDVLFESMAAELGSATAGCLLTGMGRDGAAGLLAMRQAGGHTIAQDEATSVVFGMPREAILLGAAQQVLPLGEIGARLAALAPPREAPIGSDRP
jgi:two-component system chemotaxis response regulator CheB